MPRGLRHVALSISFLSPMARRPDALFATNIASLIFLPDLRFLASTSFQSLNRPNLSSGSSSRISRLKQSFSVSRPRLRPPGNIHRWSRLLLTNSTRPRFVATSLDDFAITLPHCLNAESSVQILFHPVRKERHRLCPADLSKESGSISTFRAQVGHFRSTPDEADIPPVRRHVSNVRNRVSSTRHRTQRDVDQKTSHMGGITDGLAQIASNARQRRFLPDSFLAFRRGFFFAFSTSA
jgi:hypothetical protein